MSYIAYKVKMSISDEQIWENITASVTYRISMTQLSAIKLST